MSSGVHACRRSGSRLVFQHHEELDREEGIAACLLVDELGEWFRALHPAVEGIGDEPTELIETEGGQYYVVHEDSGLANRPQRLHEGVRGTYFVVPVRADQQERAHPLAG